MKNTTHIELKPVSGSALIAKDGWSDDETVLRVEFKNGKQYEFRGLSPAMRDQYENAASKGVFLKRTIEVNIKGVLV
jgi:KTSC domain